MIRYVSICYKTKYDNDTVDKLYTIIKDFILI